MLVKNSYIKQLYRIFVILILGIGLFLQYWCAFQNGTARIIGYNYNILIPILVMIYFVALAVFQPKMESPLVKGAVLLCMSMSALFFFFVYIPHYSENSIQELANNMLFLWAPIAVLFDYLLFTPKGKFTPLSPLAWALIPIVYLGLMMFRIRYADSPAVFFNKLDTATQFSYTMEVSVPKISIKNAVILWGIFIIAGFILCIIDYIIHTLLRPKPPADKKPAEKA